MLGGTIRQGRGRLEHGTETYVAYTWRLGLGLKSSRSRRGTVNTKALVLVASTKRPGAPDDVAQGASAHESREFRAYLLCIIDAPVVRLAGRRCWQYTNERA